MITVATLYQFAPFDDPAAIQQSLLSLCVAHHLKGTIVVAREGINGTIAGSETGVDDVVTYIRTLPGCAGVDVKYSHAGTMPFLRMKVRLKKEIVTLGVPGIDPARDTGRYVDAEEWNALISEPETILIDVRNDFEVEIGTFKGAIDPRTTSFSDFPAWFRAYRHTLPDNPKVAMFCTGGVRCEKSTAFLRAEGIEDVAHLKGGILRYLEVIPSGDSLWDGQCFVFDDRVSVGHGLEIGNLTLCRACRMPVKEADSASPLFIEGVQCPACADSRTDDQRLRYAERQRQIGLANVRGEPHVGDEARKRT